MRPRRFLNVNYSQDTPRVMEGQPSQEGGERGLCLRELRELREPSVARTPSLSEAQSKNGKVFMTYHIW